MLNYHENIFKGLTEEEVKKAYNEKWLEIINNCAIKNCCETSGSALQQEKNHDIISATKQLISANCKSEVQK